MEENVAGIKRRARISGGGGRAPRPVIGLAMEELIKALATESRLVKHCDELLAYDRGIGSALCVHHGRVTIDHCMSCEKRKRKVDNN